MHIYTSFIIFEGYFEYKIFSCIYLYSAVALKVEFLFFWKWFCLICQRHLLFSLLFHWLLKVLILHSQSAKTCSNGSSSSGNCVGIWQLFLCLWVIWKSGYFLSPSNNDQGLDNVGFFFMSYWSYICYFGKKDLIQVVSIFFKQIGALNCRNFKYFFIRPCINFQDNNLPIFLSLKIKCNSFLGKLNLMYQRSSCH